MEKQPEQLKFTQPKYPNIKTKPAYKDIAPIFIEQITLFRHVSKTQRR